MGRNDKQTPKKGNRDKRQNKTVRPEIRAKLVNAVQHWIKTCAGFVVILTIILEFLIVFLGFDPLRFILDKLMLGIMSIPFFAVIKYLWETYGPNKKESSGRSGQTAEEHENPLQSLIFLILSVWKCLSRSRLVRSVALVFAIVLVSSVAASFRPAGRILGLAAKGMPAFADFVQKFTYTGESEEQEDVIERPEEVPEQPYDRTPDPTEGKKDADPPQMTVQPDISAPAPPNQEPTEPDPPEPEPEEPAFRLLKPDYEAEFTEEDNNRLFFLNGPHAVTDWADGEAVAQCLLPYIKKLREEQAPNLFDVNSEGNEIIRGKVNDASNLEKDMADSSVLDTIIQNRLDAWEVGERFSLAKLLANNMQMYAKAYLENQGLYRTVKYYYAESIHWSLESLRFAAVDTREDEAKILIYISRRYKDIAYAAPKNSEDEFHATLLKEAFECLQTLMTAESAAAQTEAGDWPEEPILPESDVSIPAGG